MSLPQTAIDVLIDLYMPLPTGLRRELADAPEALLRWQPDPEANSIAITVWHIGRLLDLLCARLLQGRTAQEERWFVDGYATQTGYDPQGLGLEGWGVLIGYSPAEVAAIPPIDIGLLLDYFEATHTALITYLQTKTMADLAATIPQPVASTESEQSGYFWCKLLLLDCTRHFGEIQAFKAAWQRQHPD